MHSIGYKVLPAKFRLLTDRHPDYNSLRDQVGFEALKSADIESLWLSLHSAPFAMPVRSASTTSKPNGF
ncbi:hypothetical protein O9992_22020 [Vibrio lentus]|nr:hypothetical protein [Vibrio lentus]